MAYEAEPRDLFALRDALRLVVERGDVSLASAFFVERIERHLSLLRRTAWRVPAARWIALADQLAELANAPSLRQPALALTDTLETARTISRRLRALVGSASHVDCDPAVWRLVEGSSPTVGILVEFLVLNAEKLLSPGAVTTLTAPASRLDWVVTYRRRERDWSFEDSVAFGRALHEIAIESLEELLIGAFKPSCGTGPFLPLSAAAAPLVDPRWKALPLFEVVPISDLSFVAGADIDSALAELAAAQPTNAWWRPSSQSVYQHTLGGPAWRDFDSACATHWEKLRDRYRLVLERAKEANRAVLLRCVHPDDQGPATLPSSEEGGAPVLLDSEFLTEDSGP